MQNSLKHQHLSFFPQISQPVVWLDTLRLNLIFQMIVRNSKISALWVCSVTLLSVLCIISSVSAVAVMSVDLGTEWMKVAVVSVSKMRCANTIDAYLGLLYNSKVR